MIAVGSTVTSREHPELGEFKVVYIEPLEEVREGCSQIVTVNSAEHGSDDTDLSDLLEVVGPLDIKEDHRYSYGRPWRSITFGNGLTVAVAKDGGEVRVYAPSGKEIHRGKKNPKHIYRSMNLFIE